MNPLQQAIEKLEDLKFEKRSCRERSERLDEVIELIRQAMQGE